MRFFTYLFLFIGVFGLSPGSARADQPLGQNLDFTAPVSQTSQVNLDAYIRSQGALPENKAIAAADLNEDGLNEYVLRDKTCEPAGESCRFTVVSETGDTVTLLGEIDARRLAVSRDSNQGVHSLLAYESGINDYQYTVYVWEPQASRYMMAEDK